MEQKDKYRELCNQEKDIPIFSKDWWMDAVCGTDNWDVILVSENEKVVAAMPYYYFFKKGMRYITQPKLTQTNGIWIKYPQNQKYTTRLSYEKELVNIIISKLNELNIAVYNQSFSPNFTNWLPFYWKGFKQITKYTYVIEDLTNLEKVFDEIDSKTRNQIRKAQRLLQVKEGLDIQTFYNLNMDTFKKQNIPIPYSFETVRSIYDACRLHNSVKIYYAVDNEENIHAAIFIVWDEERAYYLMGARNIKVKNSDAISLLLWEAIQFSSKVTKKFDFEGSMIETIENFFRAFGAKQKLYFNISKEFVKPSIFKVILRDVYNYSDSLKNIYEKVKRNKND